jgi:predicted Zn-dependent protease
MTLRRPFLPVMIAGLLAPACAPQTAALGPLPGAYLADDVAAARNLLDRERASIAETGAIPPAERALRMIELGMWVQADELFSSASPDPEIMLAEAELRFRQHRYQESRGLVDEVLDANPRHEVGLLLRSRLLIQAWRLPDATAVAEYVLRTDRRNEPAALLLGRIALLDKRYDEALEWAERVQDWNVRNAGAHLLEADVLFWDQDPAAAEPALVRALALDPFDPDARFNYGYAIWRRVDATQLDDMAAQWNLALAIDPLHYITHWHWGNGHTNLTYADYAQPEDSIVRERLAVADSLIASRRVASAIALSRAIGRDFPASVLPAMLRGSAFYMAWEMDRGARLDSAQATFERVLDMKPNYGPAHNGLAAVIKQRQFTVLAAFDSLEAEIAGTPIHPAIAAVFPDAIYYPGDRVARMATMELGPSVAYLPLIERQGREYRIPPLHKDLAEVMGQDYFRTATTFDNRQWMDIRGVGSGAAAIEYVERGAHQERKVLLHEYVHLFHGNVFTDAESRRVRQLYHDAVRDGRALDYYAANNESEFLAQSYPAYLSPVKVHPLNHKSMNTHDDLLRKDPAAYEFIDSLVTRQRRYIAGDTTALASNWAQVYVNLSESARRGDEGDEDERTHRATALLDTALVWDRTYTPALLSYAALMRGEGRFADAGRWLARAEALNPDYAPIHAARAELAGARARSGDEDDGTTVDARAALYERAIGVETDLAERAGLYRELWTLYQSHGRVPDAIAAAEEYVASAPTLSTYLRDRRDEAAAFAHDLRSAAGHATESLAFFRDLVSRKPQNYTHRAQLADALVMAGEMDGAAAVLEESQRILTAGGSPNASFAARIAEIRLVQGDTAAARNAMEPVLSGGARPVPTDLRIVRVLTSIGLTSEAHVQLDRYPEPATPAARAELDFTLGYMAEWRGDTVAAEAAYRAALRANPYHANARAAATDLGLDLPPQPDPDNL